MKLFVRFLRETMQISNEGMTLSINAYLGNEVSSEEIKEYWLEILELEHSNLRKCRFNSQPISSQQKGRKLFYGTVSLAVNSTRLVQHIFGAIQEYSGVDKPEWLD